MALKYHVHTYRNPVCNNPECERHGEIIPIDQDMVSKYDVGMSWRTFCPGCGDGAGWTLDSVSWDKESEFNELIIEMKIPLNITSSPLGDGINTPYWKHDCDKCVWLGSHWGAKEYYDFYYCKENSGDPDGCGIIRMGNEPENNESWPMRSLMDFPLEEVPLSANRDLRKRVTDYLDSTKMQLVPNTVCPACNKIAIIEDAGCCGECAKEIFF
jgi:hypothetical protein